MKSTQEEYWKTRSLNYDKLEWVSNDELLAHLGQCIGDVTFDTNILDVGTGSGKVLIYLYMLKGQANYHGLDISNDMMDKIDPGFNFNLLKASVTDMSVYPDFHFDYVTARMVFHHVDDPDKGFREVHKKLKKGGKLILCEGNPPSYDSYRFYEKMFSYKEERLVFMESDIINYFVRNKFRNITTRTVMLSDMSLNNWIDNSGLPDSKIRIIKDMHYQCSDQVKKDYNMREVKNDILMDWKFSIVEGEK